jgi:hypothetical protein
MLVPFAEVHVPLFLGGKNFSTKLDASKHQNFHLIIEKTDAYDRLFVLHGDHGALVGSSFAYAQLPKEKVEELKAWVKTQQPDPEPAISQPALKPGKFQKVISAQVNTPVSHVFGEGDHAA